MLRLTLQGERPKRAVANLAREGTMLARASGREVPATIRKQVAVVAGEARAILFEDLGDARVHVVPFRTGAGALGALVLDGAAGALLVHAAFGGSAIGAPAPGEVTASERIVVRRVAAGIVRGLAGVLSDARIALVAGDDTSGLDSHPLGSLELSITRDGNPIGSMHVLLPLSALDRDAPTAANDTTDPRMKAILSDVEVELVAELGRTRMVVASLSSLRVGDVVRLPVAEDAPVSVRVGDKALFTARPTTAGGRLAVEIDGHET